MSGFTPSTEQVRAGYADDPVAEWHSPDTYSTKPAERAFDRWLAAERAKAWDEGYLAGVRDLTPNAPLGGDNPYRERVD